MLGRCVRDVRVCSSPGRDREKDESKVAKQQRGGDPLSSDNPPPAKRARKRGQRSNNVIFFGHFCGPFSP